MTFSPALLRLFVVDMAFPAHVAAYVGDLEHLRMLVDNHVVSVNERDDKGSTPAHKGMLISMKFFTAECGTDCKITHVCLSLCHFSYGYNSHSVSIKLCMVVWNPKNKIEFVRGHDPTVPSPSIIHFLWQELNATVWRLVNRLWHLIAQRTLIGGHYTDSIEKYYNAMLF